MKRAKKNIEKRTYALKNAFPRFVSIVDRGANLIPLSELRFSDSSEKFADVEINRIVFSKEIFKDKAAVESYLQENSYEEYSIEEIDNTFVVPGMDSELFDETQSIEYDDGVMYFVGKLKQAVEDEPVTAIVESETLEFTENVEAASDAEVVAESEVEASEEIVANSEDNGNEEAQSEEINTSSEESENGNSTEAGEQVQESQEEVVSESEDDAASSEADKNEASDTEIVQESETKTVDLKAFLTTEKYGDDYYDFRKRLEDLKENHSVIFTFDYITYIFNDCSFSALYQGDMEQFKKNCSDYFKAVKALVEASKNLAFSEEEVIETEEVVEEVKFSFTKEDLDALIEQKLQKFKEKEQDAIDETEIIIQNRQSVTSDEVITTDNKSEETERVEKFNAQSKKDLFGLR